MPASTVARPTLPPVELGDLTINNSVSLPIGYWQRLNDEASRESQERGGKRPNRSEIVRRALDEYFARQLAPATE